MNGQPKWKTYLGIAALWFTSFSVMYSMLTTVILNDLYIAFPNDELLVTATLSWPFILTAVSGLVGGWLLRFMSAKTELIVSSVLILMGVAPRFFQTPECVLMFCMIQGVGAGFANTAGMAMINEMFADEAKRSKQMGYYNFVMAIGGVVISFFGGLLAVNGWQFAYDIYFIAIPMIILAILFLPNSKNGSRAGAQDTLVAEEAAVDTQEDESKGSIGKFAVFFITSFLWFMISALQQAFISVYLGEVGVGDVAFAGVCTSLTTVGSACACVLFGFIFPHFRRKVMCYAIGVCGLSFIALWAIPSMPTAIVCSLAYGTCYGSMMTIIFAYGASCMPTSRGGLVMGIMTFNYSLSISIAAYLWTFVMGITGGMRPSLLVGVAMLTVILVVEIVCSIRDDKVGFLSELKPQR